MAWDEPRPFERIERILGKLQELWEQVPDMRFGQLVGNYFDPDFYTEDDTTEARIDKALREMRGER